MHLYWPEVSGRWHCWSDQGVDPEACAWGALSDEVCVKEVPVGKISIIHTYHRYECNTYFIRYPAPPAENHVCVLIRVCTCMRWFDALAKCRDYLLRHSSLFAAGYQMSGTGGESEVPGVWHFSRRFLVRHYAVSVAGRTLIIGHCSILMPWSGCWLNDRIRGDVFKPAVRKLCCF